MSISSQVFPSMPTRPCQLCLSLQGGAVFADFDADELGRLFLIRISFDGYGCCHAPQNIGRMSIDDSRIIVSSVERGLDVDIEIAPILYRYFGENAALLWPDALTEHELIK